MSEMYDQSTTLNTCVFEFEWDPAKLAKNIRKHEIGFELASTVLKDPLAISMLDHDHCALEERWITMGHTRDGRLLVVSHTWTETDNGTTTVRLISARRATRRERHEYESSK